MIGPPCRHLPEPDERERTAAAVAQLLPQSPGAVEQLSRLVQIAGGELDVRETRPGVGATLVAPDPLEVRQPPLEQRPRLAVVAHGADDVRPVEQDIAGRDPAGDVGERLQGVLEREPHAGRVGIEADHLGDVDERRNRLLGVFEGAEQLEALGTEAGRLGDVCGDPGRRAQRVRADCLRGREPMLTGERKRGLVVARGEHPVVVGDLDRGAEVERPPFERGVAEPSARATAPPRP